MANLHDGKFSKPFESVRFRVTDYIPREFMVTNTYFQTFHNLNQTVPFVVRFILTSKG